MKNLLLVLLAFGLFSCTGFSDVAYMHRNETDVLTANGATIKKAVRLQSMQYIEEDAITEKFYTLSKLYHYAKGDEEFFRILIDESEDTFAKVYGKNPVQFKFELQVSNHSHAGSTSTYSCKDLVSLENYTLEIEKVEGGFWYFLEKEGANYKTLYNVPNNYVLDSSHFNK